MTRAAPLGAIVLAFGIMYVGWGTTYLAIQVGVRDEHLPVLLFGGVRIGLAGVLILLFQVCRGRRIVPERRDLPGIFVVSILMFLAGNGLITLGEKTVPSGMAAVLVATTPLWLGLFALALPHGERLNLYGWVGLGLGLVGVLVLLSPRLDDVNILLNDAGPFYVLASAASWALGSLLLKYQRAKGDHLTTAGQQMIAGSLCMCCLGLLLGEASQLPQTITPRAAFAFFYLLIVGSLLGYVAFNWLLGQVSASQVGTYAYVNPMVAVLIGWFAGEAITPGILSGIAIILVSVFLVREGSVVDVVEVHGDEAAGGVPALESRL